MFETLTKLNPTNIKLESDPEHRGIKRERKKENKLNDCKNRKKRVEERKQQRGYQIHV